MNDIMINPAFSWHPANVFYEDTETCETNTSKVQPEHPTNIHKIPDEYALPVFLIWAILMLSIFKYFKV